MSGGHAHYVIADRDGHRVWSRIRGAYTLWHDVLRGPDATIGFIRDQKGGTADFWMNSVWWNAVLLLDLPRRTMLVHVMDDVRDPSIPEIRVWLRVVRALWPGWEVTWATRSLHAVMEYLGLPYGTVTYLDDPPFPQRPQWGGAPVEDEDLSVVAETLVAVRTESGVGFAGDWGQRMSDVLLAGPDVLLVPQREATASAAMEAVPNNGLLVDAPNRRADWWASDLPIGADALPGPWQGWTLTDHGDAYEEVAALIGPELLIEPPADPAGGVLSWLERNAAGPGVRERIRVAALEGA
jgi:hypothetical protein